MIPKRKIAIVHDDDHSNGRTASTMGMDVETWCPRSDNDAGSRKPVVRHAGAIRSYPGVFFPDGCSPCTHIYVHVLLWPARHQADVKRWERETRAAHKEKKNRGGEFSFITTQCDTM